ncbi:hypothetical protein LSAT2_031855, partial [Lamellibrachia satsuma]
TSGKMADQRQAARRRLNDRRQDGGSTTGGKTADQRQAARRRLNDRRQDSGSTTGGKTADQRQAARQRLNDRRQDSGSTTGDLASCDTATGSTQTVDMATSGTLRNISDDSRRPCVIADRMITVMLYCIISGVRYTRWQFLRH